MKYTKNILTILIAFILAFAVSAQALSTPEMHTGNDAFTDLIEQAVGDNNMSDHADEMKTVDALAKISSDTDDRIAFVNISESQSIDRRGISSKSGTVNLKYSLDNSAIVRKKIVAPR